MIEKPSRLPAAARNRLLTALAASLLLFAAAASADDTRFESELLDIQHRWAAANYSEAGRQQKAAFASLLDDARQLVRSYPDRAEALVWQGIVASTYAGVKGPFGAMSLANEARDALLAAEKMDPAVLDGSVYTSLGTLYYKVPGGIIGFGDKQLAREYLEKALMANPDGIDPNYFYGEFLFELKDFAGAKKALLKAQHAAPRPDRPLADEGRQHEIANLLEQVNGKLRRQS